MATDSAATATPLIRVRGLTKSFGAVRALKGVDIEFEQGQVHGLVGANGAGKSTLLNMLGGAVRPDAGTIELDGRLIELSRPREAADLGFAFIWQELALVPEFSAVDNMTLGSRARTFLGLGDRRLRKSQARKVAARLGLNFNLNVPVKTLSVAERGLVAIGRALVAEAKFVAMDEPTSSLSDVETSRLFAVVKELATSGVAVVYVSHRLKEIEDLCDVVTIFKDGARVAQYRRSGYSIKDLVMGITGARTMSEATEMLPDKLQPGRTPVLELRHIGRPPRVHDVSFVLHKGEVLGLAGVVGAGRTEIARIIFGADRPHRGEMTLSTERYAPRSVGDAISRGLALVPEERRSQALDMADSVTANINMGNWKASRFIKYLPFISQGLARSRAREMAASLSIKMADVSARLKTLSGGNQQKVVFGRWLSRNSKVLILDEPTRGVDVGARHQIWQAAESFAAKGNSVLVICSELAELSVCHRVVLIVEGRDAGEIQGPGVTEEQMNEAIFSVERRIHGQAEGKAS